MTLSDVGSLRNDNLGSHLLYPGEAFYDLKQLAERFFEKVGETAGSPRPITDDAKDRCAALGGELVRRIKETSA